MTQIQQDHWELTMDYIGHPYYVSGEHHPARARPAPSP